MVDFGFRWDACRRFISDDVQHEWPGSAPAPSIGGGKGFLARLPWPLPACRRDARAETRGAEAFMVDVMRRNGQGKP